MNMSNINFQVDVHTTSGRGFSSEELSERCVDRIVHVSENAIPAVRDQVHAFKKTIKSVIREYMDQASRSDRTTVWNALQDAGHPELAELIRKL